MYTYVYGANNSDRETTLVYSNVHVIIIIAPNVGVYIAPGHMIITITISSYCTREVTSWLA